MTPFKTQAHIHSLNGKMDEITVLEKIDENDYIVDYKGVNYADDVYGRIE